MKKFLIGIVLIGCLVFAVRSFAQALTPQQIQQAQQAVEALNAEYYNDQAQIANLQTQIANLQSDAAAKAQSESYLQAVVTGYQVLTNMQTNGT